MRNFGGVRGVGGSQVVGSGRVLGGRTRGGARRVGYVALVSCCLACSGGGDMSGVHELSEGAGSANSMDASGAGTSSTGSGSDMTAAGGGDSVDDAGSADSSGAAGGSGAGAADDQTANVDGAGDSDATPTDMETAGGSGANLDGAGAVEEDDASSSDDSEGEFEAELPGDEQVADGEPNDSDTDDGEVGDDAADAMDDEEFPDMADDSDTEDDPLLMTDHCAAAADWDPEWVAFEEEVLALVNEVRAVGYDCDTSGVFEATEPLEMDPLLVCAARLHSLDMYERGYFEHESPDGISPTDRIIATGYEPSWSGENIAKGQQTPEQVVQGWLDSDGHCGNMLRPDYVHIGVGYHPGDYVPDSRFSRDEDYHLWTQAFASPRGQGGGGGGGGGFGGGGFGGGGAD